LEVLVANSNKYLFLAFYNFCMLTVNPYRQKMIPAFDKFSYISSKLFNICVLLMFWEELLHALYISLRVYHFSIIYWFYFRRALKATFVLIPLFGVQLAVTIYRTPLQLSWSLYYERFSEVLSNSQVNLI